MSALTAPEYSRPGPDPLESRVRGFGARHGLAPHHIERAVRHAEDLRGRGQPLEACVHAAERLLRVWLIFPEMPLRQANRLIAQGLAPGPERAGTG